ncbi:MAG: Lrp/AsnC family transcriptional regulator [Nitrososphaerales archaeon]
MSRLLAFIDIFVESPHMDDVIQELAKLPNMEELYEVTGEFDIVSLVSAADIEEFRDVLKNKIMKIKGVKSTVSSVVLHSHKGPRCANNGKQTQSASAAAYSVPTAGLR